MAQFRTDQPTPGAGTPGISRHDLVAGEQITLVATAPVGAGVTYSWEVLDKLGSVAMLSASTGSTVILGSGGSSIVQPCAFRVRMTANDNGVITSTTRVFGVTTANLGLRLPLFGETAPVTNTIGANDPDRSDDNAVYTDLSGLGITAQNWRGYAEAMYRLTLAVDSSAGGGGAFIFRPGSTPGPSVYASWEELHTAVNAYDGPKIVYIDSSYSPPEIDGATFSIAGWDIRGYGGNTASLVVKGGSTMTINNASGSVILRDISLTLEDLSVTHAFVLSGTFATWTMTLFDSNINGIDGSTELIHVNLGAGNGSLNLSMHGNSSLGTSTVLGHGVFAAINIDMYDRSAVYEPTVLIDGATPASLLVQVFSEEARFAVQSYTGSTIYGGTGTAINLSIVDTQVGTTEKLVGSFYLRADTVLFSGSRALIGGSTVVDGARLNIKKGPTLIAYFEISASVLSDVQIIEPVSGVNDNVLVDTAGWYDIYLSAPSAPETAVVRGLRLHILQLS